MRKLCTCSLLTFLAMVGRTLIGQTVAGEEKKATLTVSAVVIPVARLEIRSATAVTVHVATHPNANVLVWADTDSCAATRSPKTIATPGIHQLAFTPEEVQGTNLFCLTSTDGILNISVRRPQ